MKRLSLLETLALSNALAHAESLLRKAGMTDDADDVRDMGFEVWESLTATTLPMEAAVCS